MGAQCGNVDGILHCIIVLYDACDRVALMIVPYGGTQLVQLVCPVPCSLLLAGPLMRAWAMQCSAAAKLELCWSCVE